MQAWTNAAGRSAGGSSNLAAAESLAASTLEQSRPGGSLRSGHSDEASATSASSATTSASGLPYVMPRPGLPKLRCPRGALGNSQRSQAMAPKTPRRRHGRLAAGAALTFFFNSSGGGTSSTGTQTVMARNAAVMPVVLRRANFVSSAKHSDGDEMEAEVIDRLAVTERSQSVNEELLLFFFQLDLTTRLQRALNKDEYEAAQQLREKIADVEQEVQRQRELKMGSGSAKAEVQDKALAILGIRSELQKAIEQEQYAEAALLRDRLSQLEAETLAASAQALAFTTVEYRFRLGQVILHKEHKYRGVICGMESMCCESDTWAESAEVDRLPRGRCQPFYQVLVDRRDSPGFVVAYVPEERIVVPGEKDKERSPFDHPYTYLLFLGVDSAGDFIPSKQLREKYGAPRHELPYDGEDNSEQPPTD
eukprot:SM000045S16224  [mRNA]  locus=s45:295652:298329:- [translate_table: standard]